MRRNPRMNDLEKSDGLVVPTKLPNEAGVMPAEEAMEGRSVDGHEFPQEPDANWPIERPGG
jgi:hypothetical protein